MGQATSGGGRELSDWQPDTGAPTQRDAVAGMLFLTGLQVIAFASARTLERVPAFLIAIPDGEKTTRESIARALGSFGGKVKRVVYDPVFLKFHITFELPN